MCINQLRMLQRLLPALSLILLLASCATNIVTMSVKEPAPVSLPAGIDKVGVVNRTAANAQTAEINKIDEILTGETGNIDGEGTEQSLLGMVDALNENKRFEEIILMDSLRLTTPASGALPSPMPWDQVTKICQERNVQLLFSLELFDTDSRIDYKTIPVTIKGPLGIEIPGIEHEATMWTNVKTGWRIYDPANKLVLDACNVAEEIKAQGRGLTPIGAVAGLLGRKEAVKQVGYKAGRQYAVRILPYWIRVSRDYYVKGSPNFEIAKRRAQTGNWDGAAEMWEKDVNHQKGKVAGRACYNMAIIAEINGDLEIAVEWAQKSYEDYGDKIALRYVKVLNNRIARREELLRQQENE